MAMTNDERRLALEARRRLMDGTAKVICRAAGVSLDEIAERTGVSKVTAWRWLEQQGLPRSRSAIALAELLREALPEALQNLDQEERAADDQLRGAEENKRAVAQLQLLLQPGRDQRVA